MDASGPSPWAESGQTPPAVCWTQAARHRAPSCWTEDPACALRPPRGSARSPACPPSRNDPDWCDHGSGPGHRSGDPSIRAPPTAGSCRSSASRPPAVATPATPLRGRRGRWPPRWRCGHRSRTRDGASADRAASLPPAVRPRAAAPAPGSPSAPRRSWAALAAAGSAADRHPPEYRVWAPPPAPWPPAAAPR